MVFQKLALAEGDAIARTNQTKFLESAIEATDALDDLACIFENLAKPTRSEAEFSEIATKVSPAVAEKINAVLPKITAVLNRVNDHLVRVSYFSDGLNESKTKIKAAGGSAPE